MPDINQWLAMQEETALKRRQADAEGELQRRMQTQAFGELAQDPRWKVYADEVRGRLDRAAKVWESRKAKLDGAFLDPKEYGQVKTDQAYFGGQVEALKWAVGVIERVVPTKDLA